MPISARLLRLALDGVLLVCAAGEAEEVPEVFEVEEVPVLLCVEPIAMASVFVLLDGGKSAKIEDIVIPLADGIPSGGGVDVVGDGLDDPVDVAPSALEGLGLDEPDDEDVDEDEDEPEGDGVEPLEASLDVDFLPNPAESQTAAQWSRR